MTTATKSAKTNRYTKAQKDVKKAAPKHQGKHPAISSGDYHPISESVGVHFRTRREEAPAVGDLVAVTIGRQQVELVVRHAQEAVNGTDTIIFAFTFIQGQYLVLQENKGDAAIIEWR